MKTEEIEKGNAFSIVETIEYIPNSVVSKILLKKMTGMVSMFSVDSGKGLSERTFPFDNFILIVDGTAEVVLESKSIILNVGQAIIIPAHTRYSIPGHVPFKMLSTIIKSGYEEIT